MVAMCVPMDLGPIIHFNWQVYRNWQVQGLIHEQAFRQASQKLTKTSP